MEKLERSGIAIILLTSSAFMTLGVLGYQFCFILALVLDPDPFLYTTLEIIALLPPDLIIDPT
jgi:hypothetical protein